jgi:predicted esterase
MDVPSDFRTLVDRVFGHHQRGEYHAALQLVQSATPHFPDHADRLHYWQACLACRLGQLEQSLATLEAALAQGLWWAPEMLRHDPDLAPLQDHPAFRTIVLACTEHLRAAQAGAVVTVDVHRPERPRASSPLLIALHWRLRDPAEFAARWLPAVQYGVTVAVPRSTQQLGMRAFGWDDSVRAVRDVATAYALVQETETLTPTAVILAGASQGATLAARLALQGQDVSGTGFIAVVPAITHPADLPEEFAAARERGVRGWILTGEYDAGRAAAEAFHARLTAGGVPCHLEVVAGLGHDFPQDFVTRLPAALAFVLDAEPATAGGA